LDVKILISFFLVEAFLMISRTAEYALRALVMLGSNPGNRLFAMHRRLDQ